MKPDTIFNIWGICAGRLSEHHIKYITSREELWLTKTNYVTQSMEWSHFWKADTQEYSQHFKEPEHPSPSSQQSTTCPSHEPDLCSPQPPIHVLCKIHFYILPANLDLHRVVSFLHVSPPKRSVHFSSSPNMQHALPIPPSLIQQLE